MKAILWSLVIFSSLMYLAGQDNTNPCAPFQTCSECIVGGGDCAWCEDKNYKEAARSRSRCDFFTNINGTCVNITNPASKVVIPSGGNQPLSSTVQVTPQEVQLTLRPGRASTFRIKVRPAENYPVDLYYLMDLSFSMKDDLDNLKILGQKIASTIGSITTNYRLGFGSFVDKTVSPYVQIEKQYPCSICRKTFGFQHNQDFTKNAKVFEDGVKRQTISGNWDSPEGGLDALMQVAVCENKIGWQPKEKARRLVIFVTDAPPHIAGDGKFGGIVAPNDGVCHLDSNNVYSFTNLLDYPSVGFLKQKLGESKIVPILAVTKDVQSLYESLAYEWKDLGATTGVLAGDSGNILDLLRDAYNKITSTVRLVDNTPDVLKVEYKTIKCSKIVQDSWRDFGLEVIIALLAIYLERVGRNPDERRIYLCIGVELFMQGTGSQCTSVSINEEVEFEVSVTALDCTPELKALTSFKVSIPGFGDVNVKTSVICECGCESVPPAVPSSPVCNNNGTYACGSCKCDKGRFGDFCECDNAAAANDTLCIRANDTSGAVCNNLGRCICGKCACFKRSNPDELITGTYCQCINFGCDKHEGKVCGGAGHGKCVCGQCKCEGIWTGSNCGKRDCVKLKQNCLFNGKVCSGHGTCDCGTCICDTFYMGSHCQSCPTCQEQCSKYRDCVLCKAFKMGNMTACRECQIDVQVVNATIPFPRCKIQDDNGCEIVFGYIFHESGNFTAIVRGEKVCPGNFIEKPNILAIALGTVAGVVLAGLVALLIWKLLVSAYDKYEYHRFEKERLGSKWQKAENPLYKQAKQKYDNPVYAGER